MSKTKLQDDEAIYKAMFGEDSICSDSQDALTLEDLDESIADCQAMLSYSLDLNDKNEIAAWRKMLQRAKCDRRRLATA